MAHSVKAGQTHILCKAMPGKTGRRKTTRAKKRPVCPLCRSHKVIPIIYGFPSPEMQKALRRRQAVLNSCQTWEGQPEWHCNECGCEWRGSWIVFKRG